MRLLHAASINGHHEVVKTFVEAGAYVNQLDEVQCRCTFRVNEMHAYMYICI